ncbi:MAG: hypothetical protein J7J76_07060 [Candidatus Latescibacteria bacterium]|nr:hypothetical protein [Candidatus Latescibacterota bacterium]
MRFRILPPSYGYTVLDGLKQECRAACTYFTGQALSIKGEGILWTFYEGIMIVFLISPIVMVVVQANK